MLESGGVLPVDKPVGPTSHDVVAAARRALGLRRVGHTGTLDPFASGLLLLCLGPATRIAEFLTPLPKRYHAIMRLGAATDTDDLEGETVSTTEAWHDLSEHAVRTALLEQVGTREQVPPLYSAKKVGGERMYAAARRGDEVERRASTVTIHGIEVREIRLPDVEFEVDCSGGTYIRAIARDAGETLGVGGHLRALRRTGTGGFEVAGAVPMDRLQEKELVAGALVTPAAALAHLPRVVADDGEIRALGHGRPIAAPDTLPSDAPVVIVSEADALVAVADARDGLLRPRKVFA